MIENSQFVQITVGDLGADGCSSGDCIELGCVMVVVGEDGVG